jgi:hypothetical protein
MILQHGLQQHCTESWWTWQSSFNAGCRYVRGKTTRTFYTWAVTQRSYFLIGGGTDTGCANSGGNKASKYEGNRQGFVTGWSTLAEILVDDYDDACTHFITGLCTIRLTRNANTHDDNHVYSVTYCICYFAYFYYWKYCLLQSDTEVMFNSVHSADF